MIKFVDDDFFLTYYEHKLDGKTYICLGDACPPCEFGDEPRLVVVYDAPELDDESG